MPLYLECIFRMEDEYFSTESEVEPDSDHEDDGDHELGQWLGQLEHFKTVSGVARYQIL